jgi:hypothetical protein
MATPILPKRYSTVSRMYEAKINIKGYCEKCRLAFKVDLKAIIMTNGPDYSLLGKHPPCRIYECDGQCSFLVSASKNTPMVTLDRWVDE